MAYTLGVYELDAETGRAAVYLVDPSDPSDTDPFDDPATHRNRVLFHTDNDYLEVFYAEDYTLSLASASPNTEATHTLTDHNLGSVPYALLVIDGEQQMKQVVKKTSTRYRSLELIATTNGFEILERRIPLDTGVSFPAETIDVSVYGLRPAPTLDASNSFDINPEAGVVQFGFGRFSTAGNPKIKLTNGTPDFYFQKFGMAIDGVGGGLRICRANGTNDDFWSYGGSLANLGSWGSIPT